MLSKFKRNVVDLLIDSVASTLSADLSGTITVSNTSTNVVGVGTTFTSDFTLDDRIFIGQRSRQVASITNNTLLIISSAFSTAASANTYKRGQLDNNNYYVFASRQSPYDNESSVANTIDNDYEGGVFLHDDMMFGKKVVDDSIKPVVAKKEWKTNTLYTEYDDKDPELSKKDFYIVTSENKVYKCIYNNQNSYSTYEPDHTDVGVLSPELDGYIWLYLYTISNEQMLTFATENFIPIIENSNVKKAAIDGAIFNMVVVSNGTSYPATNGTITTTSNASIIKIGDNSSTSNGFFSNCGITIINNSTNVTYVKEIRDYVSNTGGKFVVTKIPFTANEVANNDPFSIAPFLKVESKTGSNCVAYAVMQNISNTTFVGSLNNIEIVNSGKGYKQANVTVQTSASYGSDGQVRAIISPKNGHGSNINDELFCHSLGFGVEFSNSATFAFSSDVEFRTVGIIKNPLEADKTSGTGAIDLVANSLVVEGSSTLFTTEINIGDHIVYSDEQKEVSKIDDDTSITLASPFSYTVVGEAYHIRKRFSNTHFNQTAVITASNTTPLQLSIGEFVVGSDGAGGGSQAQGKVAYANSSQVILTGLDYDQSRGNTNQVILLNDTLLQGVGYIVEGANTPTIAASGAKYSKVASNSTNANGAITTAPNIKLYSGEILYVQNILPVQRSNTTNEQIRLVIKF